MSEVPYQRKAIDGFPGYEIDTEGNVWSSWNFKGEQVNNWRSLKGHCRKNSRHKDGEMFVYLRKDAMISKNIKISRIVAKTFIPNPKNLPLVCHNDSNPLNNKVENLRWDDQKGNMKDRKARKLYGLNKGSINGAAKLTEKQARIIKYAIKYEKPTRDFQRYLGGAFGIHRRTVGDIVNGITWKHIKI